MTCNQLITLLEVYRYGKMDKIKCGTTEKDLCLLRSNGLIETEEDGSFVDRKWYVDSKWYITPKGQKKVEAILELC